MRGAGWSRDGTRKTGAWTGTMKNGKQRSNDWPTCDKSRWRKQLAEAAPTIRWPECLGKDSRQLALLD